MYTYSTFSCTCICTRRFICYMYVQNLLVSKQKHEHETFQLGSLSRNRGETNSVISWINCFISWISTFHDIVVVSPSSTPVGEIGSIHPSHQCCGTWTVSFWPKKNRNRILALGSGSCCTKNININLLWRDTGWHLHEAGERRNKNQGNRHEFLSKNNLK